MDTHEYHYFSEGPLSLARIRIEQDPEPWNPRTDMDGNIGTLACWHPRYRLGDDFPEKEQSPGNQLWRLAHENMEKEKTFRYAKEHMTSDGETLLEYASKKLPSEDEYGNRESFEQELFDEILEVLTGKELITLLENGGYVILPVYIYDHGGISMHVGSKYEHYDAQWDCSQVGFIFATKKDLENAGITTDENWKEKLKEILTAEVKTYDQYLTGDVYGYILEEYKNENWTETDSCWGFYSDKLNDELAEEIAKEVTSQPFISADEALSIKNAIDEHEQKERDKRNTRIVTTNLTDAEDFEIVLEEKELDAVNRFIDALRDSVPAYACPEISIRDKYAE